MKQPSERQTLTTVLNGCSLYCGSSFDYYFTCEVHKLLNTVNEHKQLSTKEKLWDGYDEANHKKASV